MDDLVNLQAQHSFQVAQYHFLLLLLHNYHDNYVFKNVYLFILRNRERGRENMHVHEWERGRE